MTAVSRLDAFARRGYRRSAVDVPTDAGILAVSIYALAPPT
jgi:hypothetical protein